MGAYLIPGWAWAYPAIATTASTRTTAPGGARGSSVPRTRVPSTVSSPTRPLIRAGLRTMIDHAAEEAAHALSTLNMAAHAATKARARGAVISMIRGMIDEDITPQYGRDRVASRASA